MSFWWAAGTAGEPFKAGAVTLVFTPAATLEFAAGSTSSIAGAVSLLFSPGATFIFDAFLAGAVTTTFTPVASLVYTEDSTGGVLELFSPHRRRIRN